MPHASTPHAPSDGWRASPSDDALVGPMHRICVLLMRLGIGRAQVFKTRRAGPSYPLPSPTPPPQPDRGLNRSTCVLRLCKYPD
jgi:hypothetical protein